MEFKLFYFNLIFFSFVHLFIFGCSFYRKNIHTNIFDSSHFTSHILFYTTFICFNIKIKMCLLVLDVFGNY